MHKLAYGFEQDQTDGERIDKAKEIQSQERGRAAGSHQGLLADRSLDEVMQEQVQEHLRLQMQQHLMEEQHQHTERNAEIVETRDEKEQDRLDDDVGRERCR